MPWKENETRRGGRTLDFAVIGQFGHNLPNQLARGTVLKCKREQLLCKKRGF